MSTVRESPFAPALARIALRNFHLYADTRGDWRRKEGREGRFDAPLAMHPSDNDNRLIDKARQTDRQREGERGREREKGKWSTKVNNVTRRVLFYDDRCLVAVGKKRSAAF